MKRIYIMLLLAICLLASCAPQDRGNVNVLVDSIQEPIAAGTDTTTAAESQETTGIDIDTSMFYTYVHNAYRYDSSVEKKAAFTNTYEETTDKQTTYRTTTFHNKDYNINYIFHGLGVHHSELEGFDSSFVSMTINGKAAVLFDGQIGKRTNKGEDIDFGTEPPVYGLVFKGKQWLMLQGPARTASGRFRQIMHTMLVNMSPEQPEAYWLYTSGELDSYLYPKLNTQGDSLQLLITSPASDDDGYREDKIHIEIVTIPLH